MKPPQISSIVRHGKWVVILALVLTVLAGFYAARHLHFDSNQDHLISEDHKYLKDYVSFLKNFGDWEYLYVVIEVPETNPLLAKKVANALVRDLESRPDLFAEATTRIPVQNLFDAALLYLDANQFDRVLNILREKKSTVSGFLAIEDAAGWYHWLQGLFTDQNLSQWSDKNIKTFWPLLKSGLFAPFDPLEAKQLETAGLIKRLSGHTLDPEGYLFSDDGKLLFVQVMPSKNYSKMEIIDTPLKYLREREKKYEADYREIKIGITGRPVLQDDEARTTGEDSQWTGWISLILVTALYLLSVRRAAFALLGVFSLCLAIVWTLGFVSLVYGTVNLLTVSFAVILTGLGIDYGVHFLIRYLVLTQSGLASEHALSQVNRQHSPAILLGAVTSAIAFASSWFADFEGLRQLGVVVGAGIILCAISQLIVFPALIQLFAKVKPDSREALRQQVFTQLILAVLKYPGLILTCFTLILILGLPNLFKLKVDHNLLALQDQTLESVHYEKIIREHSQWSTWFLVHAVKDPLVLKQLEQKVGRLESVIHTESINDYLPAHQEKRVFAIKNLAHDILIKPQKVEQPHSKTSGLESLEQTFGDLANRAFSQGQSNEFAELSALAADIQQLKLKFSRGEIATSPVFLKNLQELKRNIRHVLNPDTLEQGDLPKFLRQRLVGKDNTLALTIYPRHNIWDWDALKKFITEVRSVIPDVTGAPVTTYESAIRLNQGFILVGLLTLGVVALLIFMYFKSVGHSCLVFLTLLVSLIMLASMMVWWDLKINLANFFALPVLIGTGVDHTIHILHDIRHKTHWHGLLEDTLPAVAISCLTTILSFGTLAFVRHNGLASFGLIMTIGSSAIFLVNVFGVTAWLAFKASAD